MRWSYSAAQTFAQCPRKWYYGTVLANARSSDPLRKEAFLLKQLNNLHAWRGKVVDRVISDYVVPLLNKRIPIDLKQTLDYAGSFIEQQLAFGRSRGYRNGSKSSSQHYCAFFELEYDGCLDEKGIEVAKEEIKVSLTNFYNSKFLSEIYNEKSYLIAQRSLQFPYADVTITSMPDLIIFFEKRNPMIVDWKVQSPLHKDHWVQLGIYAWALSKVKPHRDFPSKWHGVIKDPTKTNLLEFQLLRNREKQYTITDEDILDIEDHLFDSSKKMLALTEGNGKASELGINVFPTAKSPSTCMSCAFRKICWDGGSSNCKVTQHMHELCLQENLLRWR